jgi:hypothetical protein
MGQKMITALVGFVFTLGLVGCSNGVATPTSPSGGQGGNTNSTAEGISRSELRDINGDGGGGFVFLFDPIQGRARYAYEVERRGVTNKWEKYKSDTEVSFYPKVYVDEGHYRGRVRADDPPGPWSDWVEFSYGDRPIERVPAPPRPDPFCYTNPEVPDSTQIPCDQLPRYPLG